MEKDVLLFAFADDTPYEIGHATINPQTGEVRVHLPWTRVTGMLTQERHDDLTIKVKAKGYPLS